MTHIEPPTDGGLPDLSSSLNPLAEPPAVVAEAAAVHTTKHPLKRKLQEREEKLEPRKLSGQTHWPDGPVTDDDLASHQSLDVKGKRGGKQEMATVEEDWRVCKVCGTSFTKKLHFDRQMNTHTGVRPYKCSLCEKSFTDKSVLKKHVLVHSDDKPHKCDVCDASFRQAYNLVIHKRRHTGEKPYTCATCGTKFAQPGSYRDHLRVHTGQQPFVCDICQCSFSRRYSLTIHKRVHASERPYKCGECPAAFLDSSALTRHIRIHTGEKPYTCNVCNISFSQSSSLKVHRRIHNPTHKPAAQPVHSKLTAQLTHNSPAQLTHSRSTEDSTHKSTAQSIHMPTCKTSDQGLGDSCDKHGCRDSQEGQRSATGSHTALAVSRTASQSWDCLQTSTSVIALRLI